MCCRMLCKWIVDELLSFRWTSWSIHVGLFITRWSPAYHVTDQDSHSTDVFQSSNQWCTHCTHNSLKTWSPQTLVSNSAVSLHYTNANLLTRSCAWLSPIPANSISKYWPVSRSILACYSQHVMRVRPVMVTHFRSWYNNIYCLFISVHMLLCQSLVIYSISRISDCQHSHCYLPLCSSIWCFSIFLTPKISYYTLDYLYRLPAYDIFCSQCYVHSFCWLFGWSHKT